LVDPSAENILEWYGEDTNLTRFNRNTFPKTATWKDSNGTKYYQSPTDEHFFHFKVKNSTINPPTGRIELIRNKQTFSGLVNYAFIASKEMYDDSDDKFFKPSIVCGVCRFN